jgi:predicted nuclease of predicted toxin-antitoxin system
VKLVFDSHISPTVARGLVRRCRGLQAMHLRDWQQRRLLHAPDPELLAAAARDGWTLVTYDLRTIVPLLRDWAETQQHHAGVILVDDATIPSHHVGALLAALVQLWQAQGEEDWRDRVVFLQHAKT